MNKFLSILIASFLSISAFAHNPAAVVSNTNKVEQKDSQAQRDSGYICVTKDGFLLASFGALAVGTVATYALSYRLANSIGCNTDYQAQQIASQQAEGFFFMGSFLIGISAILVSYSAR